MGFAGGLSIAWCRVCWLSQRPKRQRIDSAEIHQNGLGPSSNKKETLENYPVRCDTFLQGRWKRQWGNLSNSSLWILNVENPSIYIERERERGKPLILCFFSYFCVRKDPENSTETQNKIALICMHVHLHQKKKEPQDHHFGNLHVCFSAVASTPEHRLRLSLSSPSSLFGGWGEQNPPNKNRKKHTHSSREAEKTNNSGVHRPCFFDFLDQKKNPNISPPFFFLKQNENPHLFSMEYHSSHPPWIDSSWRKIWKKEDAIERFKKTLEFSSKKKNIPELIVKTPTLSRMCHGQCARNFPFPFFNLPPKEKKRWNEMLFFNPRAFFLKREKKRTSSIERERTMQAFSK